MTITLPDSMVAAADAVVAHRRKHLQVGAERLQLAAHWAVLHPADQSDAGSGRPRGRRVGADGTPVVDEFAANHLGILLGIHPFGAQQLMADAGNLEHRHPKLWKRVLAEEVPEWLASKTARLVAAADLDVNQARWVDAATAHAITSLPPGRYLALVEAKIIEADLVKAERRREAFELARFVRTGQSNDHGIKTLVARATAGDIIYFDAVVDRIAEILRLQGDQDPLDVRRSKALGILANPARALQLLAWVESITPHDEPQDGEAVNNDRELNAAIAAGLAEVDPRKLLPKAVVYVHLSEAALRSHVGVARMEDVGPITVGQARDFLRHCNVTVVPVLDVEGQRPVDGYEVPTRIGEAVRLQMPFETFPWATRTSRRADLDHTKSYKHRGPPGQTRTSNLGPLIRKHHRLKTHAPGWQVIQPSDGVYLWRAPSGYWIRVDHNGSHQRGKNLSVMEEHLGTALSRHA
ncbi:MAG TPA: hypothetical protein VLI04_11685 [Nocardioidaceae bacterium]|nr:hypothetical protein [Nocardioidaceae bacterium]